MLRIAERCSIELSYGAGNQVLSRERINISTFTAREVTNYIGGIVHACDMKRADDAIDEYHKNLKAKKNDCILYIMADGAMIRTGKQNEKGTQWDENKMGLVFSSEFMKLKSKETDTLNYNILKREYVSLLGSVDKFNPLLFSAAVRSGFGKNRTAVILSDGAAWVKKNEGKLL
jgi:hypothetical protein